MLKCLQDGKGWKPCLVYVENTVLWDHSNWGRKVPPSIPGEAAESVLFHLIFLLGCFSHSLLSRIRHLCPSVHIFFIFICFNICFIFQLMCGRFERRCSEYALRRKLTLFHPKSGQYLGITSYEVVHFAIHHQLSWFWLINTQVSFPLICGLSLKKVNWVH